MNAVLPASRAPAAAPPPHRKAPWERFARNRLALGGAAFMILLAAVCAAAPLLAPQSPTAMSLETPYGPPAAAHPFGTDALGRDVWSRVLWGGRLDLGLSVIAVVVATAGGVFVGVAAGYSGGALDEIVMRAVDVLLAIPELLLALALMAFVGPSLTSVVGILAFSRLPRYTRMVRGAVLALREREFITASAAFGATRGRLLRRHVVPNLGGTIAVYSTLDLGGVISALAGLSFIGVGVQPPTPEWGVMLADARQNLVLAPWTAVFPGLAITLTIIAFNVLGDGARDALDPRMRRRPART
jgi:peptide/nickel transport system permease protein